MSDQIMIWNELKEQREILEYIAMKLEREGLIEREEEEIEDGEFTKKSEE